MQIALSEMEKESNFVAGFLGASGFQFDETTMVGVQDFCGAVSMWQSSEHGENRNMVSNHMIWQHIKASFANHIVKYQNNSRDFYLGIKLTEIGLDFRTDMVNVQGVLAPGKHSKMDAPRDEVNKTAPVTLQRARELHIERMQKDRVRKSAEMAKSVRK
jgi:hypothetical protein